MTDPATPKPPPDTTGFPGEDALCEQCGYPLKGLDPSGDCPECGSAIASSHPDHRDGPAFEHRPGPIGYLLTATAIALHPKRTFRAMQIGGPNTNARQFLLINAVIASLLGLLATAGASLTINSRSWLGGEFSIIVTLIPLLGIAAMILLGGVLFIAALTYVEVLGVTWFSRRRGWRVLFRLAERIACYATLGWLPCAAVLGLLVNLARHDLLQEAWLWMGGSAVYAADAVWALVFGVGVLGMLGFETLVWVGVRQVKFANAASAGPG